MSTMETEGEAGIERTASARAPTVLRPLAVRDFRLLFSGEAVSLLGDQFHFVALTWLVLHHMDRAPA
jgi:hypothetical protein